MFDEKVTDNIRTMAQIRIPRQTMRQYADTFRELVRRADRHGGSYDLNAWLAMYNFKLVIDGPEAALQTIRRYDRLIPLASLLTIEERYFAVTGADDQFEKRLLGLLERDDAAAVVRVKLVAHYLRLGQVSSAIDQLRLVGQADGYAPALLRHSLRLGCWSEARSYLEECDKGTPWNRLLARKARLEIAAASRRPPGPLPADHCFISLPRSTGRHLGISARWTRLGVQPQFVDARDGLELSADEYRSWCPSARREYGSVANGLSHLRAWRRLLETSEPYAIVFEDDAWPFADLAIGDELTRLLAASKADLLFVNERGCYRWWEEDPRGFRTLASAIARADPRMRAPGGDGYVVTRAGAQKLIDNHEIDRMLCPTDWQMVLYSLTLAEIRALPEGVPRDLLERNAALRKSTDTVAAAVINFPLVDQAISGFSSVGASNALATRASTPPTG